MSTRFYLGRTYLAPACPLNGDWSNTSGFLTRGMFAQASDVVSSSDVGSQSEVLAGVNTQLMLQYLSGPLSAQSISGTVKGQMRVYEGSGTADAMALMIIRLLNPDLTHKAYLLQSPPGSLADEFGVSAANRKFPQTGSTALTTQAAAAGDRLCVEIGAKLFNVTTTTMTVLANINEGAASDLAEDNTSTAANNAWVEFSGTIGVDFNQGYVSPMEFVPEEESTSSAPPFRTTGQLWPRGW